MLFTHHISSATYECAHHNSSCVRCCRGRWSCTEFLDRVLNVWMQPARSRHSAYEVPRRHYVLRFSSLSAPRGRVYTRKVAKLQLCLFGRCETQDLSLDSLQPSFIHMRVPSNSEVSSRNGDVGQAPLFNALAWGSLGGGTSPVLVHSTVLWWRRRTLETHGRATRPHRQG